MSRFDKVRDQTRDTVCDILQKMGINAQMAERGRPEEDIKHRPLYKSLGLIDIAEGPIRWLNVIREEVTHRRDHFIKYGVPDPRLGPSSPKVKIKSAPKRKFLLFGKTTDLKWEGEDSGLGIITRLNSDDSLKQMVIKIRVNFTINAHGDRGIWIISNDYSQFLSNPLYPPVEYSEEEWRSCQLIAQHLLAE